MVVAICIRLIEDDTEVGHQTFRYTEAAELLKGFTELKQKFPGGIFHTANFSVPTPPPDGHLVPRGYYWCPWCADDMVFHDDPQFDLTRCVMCRMSDADFYVRWHNDLDMRKSEDKPRKPKHDDKTIEPEEIEDA